MALYPFTTAALTSLTAAGTSNSIKVNAQAVTFQVTTSSIGTNVVVRFEGSLDDTNFFNLDQDELDTTITANGTRGFALNGCPDEYVVTSAVLRVERLPSPVLLVRFDSR